MLIIIQWAFTNYQISSKSIFLVNPWIRFFRWYWAWKDVYTIKQTSHSSYIYIFYAMSLLTENSKKSFKFEYQVNLVEVFSLLAIRFFLFVFPHDRAVSCRPSPTLWWRSLSPLAASWRTNSDSDSWPPPRSEKYSTVEVTLLEYIL